MSEDYTDFKQVPIVWYAVTKFLGQIKKKIALLSAYQKISNETNLNTSIDEFLDITMDSVYKTVVMDFAKLLDNEQT